MIGRKKSTQTPLIPRPLRPYAAVDVVLSLFRPTSWTSAAARRWILLSIGWFGKGPSADWLAESTTYPKEHPVLGPLAPSAEAVARTLAGRDHTRLQPAGAYAANALGLSEQVPAKAVFLTDGPSPDGQDRPDHHPTSPDDAEEHGGGGATERSADPGPPRAGQGARDPGAARTPEAHPPGRKRQELIKDITLAPAWMHPIFRELAEEEA